MFCCMGGGEATRITRGAKNLKGVPNLVISYYLSNTSSRINNINNELRACLYINCLEDPDGSDSPIV